VPVGAVLPLELGAGVPTADAAAERSAVLGVGGLERLARGSTPDQRRH